jgi:hypothetical protein
MASDEGAMSAPKTPEGRAAALAKLRETTRRRPISELRQDLEQFAKRIRYAGGSGQQHREDLEQVRWLLVIAADFVQETPADEQVVKRLSDIRQALVQLAHGQSRKRSGARLRAKGATIIRSILDGCDEQQAAE